VGKRHVHRYEEHRAGLYGTRGRKEGTTKSQRLGEERLPSSGAAKLATEHWGTPGHHLFPGFEMVSTLGE